MSVYQPPYQYVIDTSALFDLKGKYPSRIFTRLWELFNEMCSRNQIVAPREVLREIKRGDDELLDWSTNYSEIFLEPSDGEAPIVQSLFAIYPREIVVKYSTRPWADPMVIACAIHYRLPIVQQETNDANQYKIPPMAAKFKVKCLNLVAFFDEQDWRF
jgi:uncharacterized protein DUF4411